MLFVEGKNDLQFVNFKRSSPKIVVNFCCKGAQVHFFVLTIRIYPRIEIDEGYIINDTRNYLSSFFTAGRVKIKPV